MKLLSIEVSERLDRTEFKTDHDEFDDFLSFLIFSKGEAE